ncbi:MULTISPECIES: LamB/YcsF family protein [unclassified Rhodococcus (in: high G+C Gram-positive bacteria)]|uniref:LamB/YcsF family protein n=1 Tax=unclassified Rhodococcus (in: high G+C Gram-positive bacteria) TaxID=192944 RepID=UPI00163B0B1A|nr:MULTISPECIES: 5-oxoprolinase subunit PxpA [unclassified Rhodococcus (in: high G+C Gram-positive bacteria)]MBC2640923.1 LamB/YcsF family protein [Rhodococcus sp. 3A]MBC2894334.1 LamB/YcsF family protein [Rhodococcus sp. 4CII]
MRIDLNCDLGEGFGQWRLADDEALLDIVTSANIACGFHAGDPMIIRRACENAAARGVAIGAHVGFRDLAGFGRRELGVAPADLRDETLYQIGALAGFASAAGSSVTYVKPHGALYNSAALDYERADAVASAIDEFTEPLALMGPPGSQLQRAAEAHGIEFVAEGFADRRYTAAGTLTPRSRHGAVIDDPDVAAAQAVRMVSTGTVESIDGDDVTVSVRSICVHGDSPGSVHTARRVRHALQSADVTLGSFT